MTATIVKTTVDFTEADYRQKKCSSHEYYSQFVTNWVKDYVLSCWSKATLEKAYAKDKNFNTLSLKKWDNLSAAVKSGCNIRALKAAQEYRCGPLSYAWSVSYGVCIAKAAARMIILESNS